MPPALTFKIASEPGEFTQIHRLNYHTFVEEIPQHPPNDMQMLVDRFHEENTYFLCLDGAKVVGMVALRSMRPFSLDYKLPALDTYLPVGHRVCEIRLLVVKPIYRHCRVLPGLLNLLVARCTTAGYTLAVVSATIRQLNLYAHLGFVPFGPLVGSGEALFQPMYITYAAFAQGIQAVRSLTLLAKV
jgi:hypothetical protein